MPPLLLEPDELLLPLEEPLLDEPLPELLLELPLLDESLPELLLEPPLLDESLPELPLELLPLPDELPPELDDPVSPVLPELELLPLLELLLLLELEPELLLLEPPLLDPDEDAPPEDDAAEPLAIAVLPSLQPAQSISTTTAQLIAIPDRFPFIPTLPCLRTAMAALDCVAVA